MGKMKKARDAAFKAKAAFEASAEHKKYPYLLRDVAARSSLEHENAFKIAEKYHAETLCAEAIPYDFSQSTIWRRG